MVVSCLIKIVSEVLEKTDNAISYTDVLLIFLISLWNIFGKKPIIAVDNKCNYHEAYKSASCNDIYDHQNESKTEQKLGKSIISICNISTLHMGIHEIAEFDQIIPKSHLCLTPFLYLQMTPCGTIMTYGPYGGFLCQKRSSFYGP